MHMDIAIDAIMAASKLSTIHHEDIICAAM